MSMLERTRAFFTFISIASWFNLKVETGNLTVVFVNIVSHTYVVCPFIIYVISRDYIKFKVTALAS